MLDGHEVTAGIYGMIHTTKVKPVHVQVLMCALRQDMLLLPLPPDVEQPCEAQCATGSEGQQTEHRCTWCSDEGWYEPDTIAVWSHVSLPFCFDFTCEAIVC